MFDYDAARAQRSMKAMPTEVEIQEIRRLKAEGKTVDELAKLFHTGTLHITMLTRNMENSNMKNETAEVRTESTEFTVQAIKETAEVKATAEKKKGPHSFFEEYPEKFEQAKQLRVQGKTIGEISKEVGIGPQTVMKALKGFEMPNFHLQRKDFFARNPEKFELAKQLKAQGKTLWEIAEKVGIGPQTVAKAFKMAGLPTNKSFFGKHPEKLEQAMQLRANGETIKDIARKIGTGYSTTCVALRVTEMPNAKTGVKDFFEENPEKLEQAKQLRIQGKSMKTIAKVVGIGPQTVAKALKKSGVKKLTAKIKKQIASEYDYGESTSYLLCKYKCYGVTKWKLYRIYEEAGVERRDERKDGNPRNEWLKPAEKDAIDRMHNQGLTPGEMVERLGGVNIGQIKAYLRKTY